MKREQLEKIARAMHALLDATECVDSVSATKSEYGRRLTFYAETDEDVQAMCGALGLDVERNPSGTNWFLSSTGELANGMHIAVIGPSHRQVPPRELDDAKVDAAVAQAVDAVADVCPLGALALLDDNRSGAS